MILSTHSVVGATVATVVTANPALGFIVGIASHFLLDMIPHWDYDLRSMRTPEEHGVAHKMMVFDRTFVSDCFRLGVDFGIGIAVVVGLAFFAPELWLVLAAGLVGGVLPDILQFGYFIAPRLLGWIQWFHTEFIHSSIEINRPSDGIFTQALVVTAALMIWIAAIGVW